MKALMAFLIVFFCLMVQGCDQLYAFLDKRGAEEKDLIGDVNPFEKNSQAEEIQKLLKIYGYNPGTIDGILGAQTRNSIEAFQRDNNLTPSRFMDQETWQRLKIFEDNQFIVNQELNLRLVQKILKREGFNPGLIDGTWGAQTKAALMSFQKKNGLKPDGKIGYKTLTQLATRLP